MKIYKITGDVRDAQSIHYDMSKGSHGAFWFDGSPKDNWLAPKGLYVHDLRLFHIPSDLSTIDIKIVTAVQELNIELNKVLVIEKGVEC